jgi:hypothetical protein
MSVYYTYMSLNSSLRYSKLIYIQIITYKIHGNSNICENTILFSIIYVKILYLIKCVIFSCLESLKRSVFTIPK